jgi:uncharacterized protein YkwD
MLTGRVKPKRWRAVAGVALVAGIVALTALVPAASAGTSIKSLPACHDDYLIYAPGEGTTSRFRTALVCLINEARRAQRLPALSVSAQLQKVGQAQSNRFAATGNGSHGSSITDITKRFAKVGYRAAAYDEGFDVLDSGATPYSFLAHMLSRTGVPCSEIFDPRFRDIGIGANAISLFDTLALEFGLRTGQRQPSTREGPAQSCPHKIPASIVGSTPPVQPGAAPLASGDTVSLSLTCDSRAPCALTATLHLPDAHASASTAGTVTIAAHKSAPLTFTFTPAQVQAELAAKSPNVALAMTITEPAQYTSTITGPLKAG